MHSAVLNARSASVGHANTEYYNLDSKPLSESRSNVKKKIVTFQDDPWTSSTTSTSSSVKTAPKTDDILRSGREWTKGAATSSTTTTAETQKTVKNLSFHTQVMCNTNVQTDAQELTEIFHSVRGLRRRLSPSILELPMASSAARPFAIYLITVGIQIRYALACDGTTRRTRP